MIHIRRIAILTVLAARPVAAEPVDTPPTQAPIERGPSVAALGEVTKRSDGSTAAGAGLSLGLATTGHADLNLRVERLTGVDGSTEKTWSLGFDAVWKLPEVWHMRSYFLVGTGFEKTSGGTGAMEMAPSVLALSSRIGFGAEVRLTDNVRLFGEIAYGERTAFDDRRGEDWFSTALVGVRVVPGARY